MVEKTCMREHSEATAGVKVRADDGLNWVGDVEMVGSGEIQDMVLEWKQHRLGMRGKEVKETGVKDTHFWCKQLGGVVPVTEGRAPQERQI